MCCTVQGVWATAGDFALMQPLRLVHIVHLCNGVAAGLLLASWVCATMRGPRWVGMSCTATVLCCGWQILLWLADFIVDDRLCCGWQTVVDGRLCCGWQTEGYQLMQRQLWAQK